MWDSKLQVTKQYRLGFSINFGFINELDLDVIPLDIRGIVLGSPYLFDRKYMFFREHNKYRLFNDGIEYIVRAHKMKNDLTMVATGQMKMLVNASKGLSLMTVKDCGFGNELVNIDTINMLHDTPQVQHGQLEHENILYCKERDPLVFTAYVNKKNLSFYISSACSVSCFCYYLVMFGW